MFTWQWRSLNWPRGPPEIWTGVDLLSRQAINWDSGQWRPWWVVELLAPVLIESMRSCCSCSCPPLAALIPVRPRIQEGLKLTLLITTHNLLHSLKITTRPLEQNFFLFTQPKAKATQSNTFQHKSCKLMQLISSHTTQCCKLLKQLMDQKHLIHPTHLVHLIGWFTWFTKSTNCTLSLWHIWRI